MTTNSLTTNELQQKISELEQIILHLEEKVVTLKEKVATFEFENSELKKKATLHQGGIIIPRDRV